MTKSYIGFARDHSGSMYHIARHAARDYNATIASVREASLSTGQDTVVSVVEIGYEHTSQVRHVVRNSSVNALQPIVESQYSANGRGTPLWDAVGALIEDFKSVPDYNDPEVAFLVMVTTDGQENASRQWSARTIAEEIKRLQATDRWTFVFRVPRGDARTLTRQGIHEGNILEWEQSERGVQTAQAATTQAFTAYMTDRSKGIKATKKFYANMADVKIEDVKAVCKNIGSEITLLPVSQREHDKAIREFVEDRLGTKMLKGAAFYQLTKTEPKVQDYKIIAVQNKQTGEVYAGPAARQMAGLPQYGDCRVAPDDLGEWNVFIQSTSVNRKVVAGTTLLYWPGVGKAFTEGKSA